MDFWRKNIFILD